MDLMQLLEILDKTRVTYLTFFTTVFFFRIKFELKSKEIIEKREIKDCN